ncbi:hypothetical protein VTN96DRAFT_1977 [Rasamsonia emersonii]
MSESFSEKIKGITAADVTFINLLKESEFSCVSQVAVQGKTCVMKMYHAVEKSPADPPDREIDNFTCESIAYQRLKAKGLCQQAVVPDFYGVIEQINPKKWQPHLKKFLNDKLRPNAVLIEYIPNICQINLSTFSERRIAKLHAILRSIHAAGVYPGDPYPRNMIVQMDTDRVFWIDFDRAQTSSEGSITERQRQWIQEEDEMMGEFVDFLKADYQDGKSIIRHIVGYCDFKQSWQHVTQL